MTGACRFGLLGSEMRRFLAAVLSSSLPLLAAVPAAADGPSRQLEYAVVATSGGIARRASVRIDFIGGSADHTMTVNVDERGDGGDPDSAYVGIEPSGSLRADTVRALTSEEDAICSLMSLESEDLAGVSTGDHWEREGPVPGGHHHTRFSVLGVNDAGLVEFAVSRDLQHNDGSVARWRGTMLYDADSSVPSTITLNGNVSTEDDPSNGRNVAMTIRLVHDTFKHY
jgi:hypothetical protein